MSACIEYPGLVRDRDGYARAKVNGRRIAAHRLAYERAHGPIPAGMLVLHRCDNPPCVNPDHLFLGTQADNMDDMTAKGRRVRGSAHGMTRLTEADVRAIRALRHSGRSLDDIGRQFGISITTVSRIALRRTWRHVA